MWVFITSRLRQWILLAVVVPLATSLIHVLRVQLEKRNPDSAVVKAMRTVEDFGRRKTRNKRNA